MPGVAAAGAASQLPLGKFDPDGALTFEGHPDKQAASATTATTASRYSAGRYKVVSTGYFESLGIHLLHGRFLEDSDSAGQPPVAVVEPSRS